MAQQAYNTQREFNRLQAVALEAVDALIKINYETSAIEIQADLDEIYDALSAMSYEDNTPQHTRNTP